MFFLQHHINICVGKKLWSNLHLKTGLASNLVRLSFECLQRRRLPNLSGRSVRSLNMVTVNTTVIPCSSPDSPLLQLITVAACSFATYLGQASACSVTPLWVAADCSEIPPSLCPSSKIQLPQPLFICCMLPPPQPCQWPPSEHPLVCQYPSCLSVAKLGIIACLGLYFRVKHQQTILKLSDLVLFRDNNTDLEL